MICGAVLGKEEAVHKRRVLVAGAAGAWWIGTPRTGADERMNRVNESDDE